jgi:hypothetical protein
VRSNLEIEMEREYQCCMQIVYCLEENRYGQYVVGAVVGSNNSQHSAAGICNHRPFKIAVVERRHDDAQFGIMLEVIFGGWEKSQGR